MPSHRKVEEKSNAHTYLHLLRHKRSHSFTSLLPSRIRKLAVLTSSNDTGDSACIVPCNSSRGQHQCTRCERVRIACSVPATHRLESLAWSLTSRAWRSRHVETSSDAWCFPLLLLLASPGFSSSSLLATEYLRKRKSANGVKQEASLLVARYATLVTYAEETMGSFLHSFHHSS